MTNPKQPGTAGEFEPVTEEEILIRTVLTEWDFLHSVSERTQRTATWAAKKQEIEIAYKLATALKQRNEEVKALREKLNGN